MDPIAEMVAEMAWRLLGQYARLSWLFVRGGIVAVIVLLIGLALTRR